MTIASTSAIQIAHIAEATWGTTPATPAFQILRKTGDSLSIERENVKSSETRLDRNITDLIQVGGGASGGIDFEVSYGTLDDFIESAMHSTWGIGTVIKNGSTPKSFTLEKKIPCGATTEYLRYTGMEVNEFSLSVKAKEIVTGSMTFIGKGGSVAQTAIPGATYVDPNDNDVMNAAAHFASLTVGGVSNPHIQGIELSVNNNLRAANAVGSVDSLGIGYGRFEVSGSMDVYFENTTLYSLFLAGTAASLTFTIGGVTGEKYTFLVPNLKFETANTESGGNDQDMMCKLSFAGLYDVSEACTLSITRAVA